MEAHTGQEPPATEGRVQAERSEPQGSLDADRAGGMSGPVVSQEGSVTPPTNTSSPGIIEESEGAIRPLSPVMVDGGTRCRNGQLPEPAPLAGRLLDHLMTMPEGGQVELPFTEPAPGGGPVWADASWSKSRGRINVTLKVQGHCWVQWRPQAGEFLIQFHAPGLWRHGFQTMADYYLRQFHELLTGQQLFMSELYSAGWRMTQIHLCADFQGIGIYARDEDKWRGVQKTEWVTRIGKLKENGRTETLYVGTGASNCRVVTYDKSLQLEQDHKADIQTYAHVWEAHGWDGQERIQRFELRLRDSGLTCRTVQDDRHQVTIDFRDPHLVTDHEMLCKAWRYWTGRKVLIVEDNVRRERCSIDPRWRHVQLVANVPDNCASLWRNALAIGEDAATRRDRLDSRKVIRALASIESRRHSARHDRPRQTPNQTLKDILNGEFDGKTPHQMLESFEESFSEIRKRQMAELGTIIEMRSRARDEWDI